LLSRRASHRSDSQLPEVIFTIEKTTFFQKKFIPTTLLGKNKDIYIYNVYIYIYNIYNIYIYIWNLKMATNKRFRLWKPKDF